MSGITISDLNTNNELDSEALGQVTGGWYWLYQPVTSYFYNPFAFNLQSSWAARGAAFDNQHNNFISFLRS